MDKTIKKSSFPWLQSFSYWKQKWFRRFVSFLFLRFILYSREIEYKQGETLKKNSQFDLFMETSAKTGFNAKELFIEAAKLLYEDYMKIAQTKTVKLF